jgi:tRNA threonylcarbamoyladenosine biosynthesis protein TsaB
VTAQPMWLAIDTATEVGSVAVGSHERIAGAQTMVGARQHAAQIIPLIHSVLAQAQLNLADIGQVVVGDGPGSFTGLRIAWAVAKGLVQERELPLFAIPSLLGAAHAASSGIAGPVVACFDALRGQVFAAMYAFTARAVETLVPPGVFEIGELARVAPARPVRAVGDGAQRYADAVLAWTGRPAVGLEMLPPIAASLLILASFEAGRRALDAASEPVYGRLAEAQVKWEARYGRPLQSTPDPAR